MSYPSADSVDGPQMAASDECCRLPLTFCDANRIEQNLAVFALSARDPVTGCCRSSSLVPLLEEAQSVLRCIQHECRTSDAEGKSSPSKPASMNSTLASLKRSKLIARTNDASLHDSIKTIDLSKTADVSPAVKYLVAACRASPSKAVELLERASAEGSLCASVELGVALTFGLGCTPSRSLGLELLDGGVVKQHPGAMFAVSKCLREGLGVPADAHASFIWLQRAAEANFVFAQHELGEVYEDGWESAGVQRSLPLALRWYKRASLSGYHESQLNLGKLLLLGSHVNVEGVANIDPSVMPSWGELHMKALYWLQEASKRGNTEARQLLERSSPA